MNLIKKKASVKQSFLKNMHFYMAQNQHNGQFPWLAVSGQEKNDRPMPSTNQDSENRTFDQNVE